MTNSPEAFYDDLAEQYALIFPDWQQAVHRQGAIISGLLGDTAQTVLDCSCGIGTQAIGLALQGYQVHGTDISSKEIAQARINAEQMGAKTTFAVADFCRLDQQVTGEYDVVISFDNALPHLLTNEEIMQALTAMRSKLRPGGNLYISIRDYDTLLVERPSATLPQVVHDENGERIYFQTWDWQDNTYETTLFVLVQSDDGWTTTSSSTLYRALRQQELTQLLTAAGYQDVVWSSPQQSGYYQPIVCATRR